MVELGVPLRLTVRNAPVYIAFLLGAALVPACGEHGAVAVDPTGTTAAVSSTAASSTAVMVPSTTGATSTTSEALGTSTSTTTTAPEAATTSTTEATAPVTSTTIDVFYSIATAGEFLDTPDPLPGSNGYFGSGCSPESDVLPDGIWFGVVRDVAPSVVTFDLACLGWDNPPPPDQGNWDRVKNNPKVRGVPVADSAQAVSCLDWPVRIPITYLDWMQQTREYLERYPEATEWSENGNSYDFFVWLYVNSGSVTEIAEPCLAG